MYTEGNTAVRTLQRGHPGIMYNMIQRAGTRGGGRQTRGRDLGRAAEGGPGAAPRVSTKLGAERDTKGERMEPEGAAQPGHRFLGRP